MTPDQVQTAHDLLASIQSLSETAQTINSSDLPALCEMTARLCLTDAVLPQLRSFLSNVIQQKIGELNSNLGTIGVSM